MSENQPSLSAQWIAAYEGLNRFIGNWPNEVRPEWADPATFPATWAEFIQLVGQWEEISAQCWAAAATIVEGQPLYRWKIQLEALNHCKEILTGLSTLTPPPFEEAWLDVQIAEIERRCEAIKILTQSVDTGALGGAMIGG